MMDKYKIRRYRTILVVFLVSVVTLFINPYISLNVMASTGYSTTFEDGTIASQYPDGNGSFMWTTSDASYGYISNEYSIGIRSWFIYPLTAAPKSCTWHYKQSATLDNYMINWSSYIWCEQFPSGGAVPWFYLAWGNNSDPSYPIVRIIFRYEDNGYKIEFDQDAIGYTNLTWFPSLDDNNEYWNHIYWYRTSNDTMSFGFNGTVWNNLIPANVTNRKIDYVTFASDDIVGGDHDFSFDNHQIILDSHFPSYYGNVSANVYNESNVTEAITNYNISVFNHLGGLEEHYINCNNPYVINLFDLGLDGFYYFQFSHGDYSTRTYYSDIDVSLNYTVTALLPPRDDSLLYYVRVLDSFTTGIYNANVSIRRIINGTSYDIESGLTDSSGYLSMYLLPNISYLVNISKNGYSSLNNQVWFTQHDCYGYLCPKLFYLNQTIPDINITSYEFLHLTGTINSTGHISVHYADGRAETIDTNMTIFESWNGTLTRNISEDRTGENVFTWVTSGYNISKTHIVWLYVNHSEIWESPYFMSITILPLDYNVTDYWDIENKFIDVFGEFDLGWVRLLILFIPCLFLLVVFGSSHSGLGILSAGLWLGFSSIMISNIPNIANIVILAGILAILGILVAVAKKGRDII